MEMAKLLALSVALAFLAESLVEYIFGTLMDKFEILKSYKWTLMYVALAAGVGLSFFYNLDLISLITDEAATVVGMILTGLIVGRGANFVHQFVSEYLPQK